MLAVHVGLLKVMDFQCQHRVSVSALPHFSWILRRGVQVFLGLKAI